MVVEEASADTLAHLECGYLMFTTVIVQVMYVFVCI